MTYTIDVHDVWPNKHPLHELSALVGFQVVDVMRGTRMAYRSGVRGLHQPKAWWLVRANGSRTAAFTSDDVRRENRLNEVALTLWGRSLELRRLTHADGRAIVRLMHEVIEAKDGDNITDNTKESES